MKNIVDGNRAQHKIFCSDKKLAVKKRMEYLEDFYNAFELKDDLVTGENEADFEHIKNAIKNVVDQRIDQYNLMNAAMLAPVAKLSCH